MDINNIFKLFSVCIFTGLYSCECVSGPNHTFEQQASFAPEQLEYKVGDTIWLSSSFSCQGLLNTSTGQTEDFCGIQSVGLELKLILLEPWQNDSLTPSPATDFFYFVSHTGSISVTSDRSAMAYFRTEENQYSLKIGLIPRRTGKFASFIFGGGPYNLPNAKKCDTGSFYFSPDVQDNHISLLADFKNGIENVPDIDKSQVYCFEVK